MICCGPNQPDCRHLEKHEEYWVCNTYGCMPIDSQMDECLHYEASGEYALRVALQKEFDNLDRTFKEFDKWRDRRHRNLGSLPRLHSLDTHMIIIRATVSGHEVNLGIVEDDFDVEALRVKITEITLRSRSPCLGES